MIARELTFWPKQAEKILHIEKIKLQFWMKSRA
jgi:hypothetical protein